MPEMTNFEVDLFALSDYASRGIRQSLNVIAAAKAYRRTINGTLIDYSQLQFRKYSSNVSCSDQVPPALDGIYPGATIVVKCASELSYVTGGAADRDVVAGSSRTEGAFTYYRPELTMLVTDFSYQFDEWGATVGWSMDLEEI